MIMKCEICNHKIGNGEEYQKIETGKLEISNAPNPKGKPLTLTRYIEVKMKILCAKHKK